MRAAITVLTWVGALNGGLLRIGRAIGVVAVALMVVAILIQVFFRYVLNNALPWPDEAARFATQTIRMEAGRLVTDNSPT